MSELIPSKAIAFFLQNTKVRAHVLLVVQTIVLWFQKTNINNVKHTSNEYIYIMYKWIIKTVSLAMERMEHFSNCY